MLKVADATNNPDGFKDGTNTGNDYTYDTMGNLKTDQNKGITSVKYNHLNLPTEVVFNTGKINYTYDAAGTRIAKKVEPTGGTSVVTDYLDGFQYENNDLQFFFQPEGYVKKDNNNYLYVFQYKDHLGNVRLSYADCNNDGEIQPADEILEENNYYPFGLRHKGYNDIANSCRSEAAERYKFGGKELNDELGFEVYDFGARNYDPALGRWMNIDPLAEEMRRFSPYNYAFNNPVFFIDPDGMAPFGFDKNKLDELKPVVDINEMLAYEPTVMGMGLEDPTDPPGGGDDGETIDGGELEELVIHFDRKSNTSRSEDVVLRFLKSDLGKLGSSFGDLLSGGQVSDMEYSLYLYETEGFNSYIYSQIGSAHRDAMFSMMGQYRGAKIGGAAKGAGKFKFPGTNPAKAPKGFEWKGKPGSTPGSKDGNWYNPKTGESLRPDLNHPDPIGPHWDYKDPTGKWWRIFQDGSNVPK